MSETPDISEDERRQMADPPFHPPVEAATEPAEASVGKEAEAARDAGRDETGR